jgi:hypothetical protein
MSQLDDFKERLKADLERTSERFQNSSAYASMKDSYDNLSPTKQKLTLFGTLGIVLLILLLLPQGTYEMSTDYEKNFIEVRDNTRGFLRAFRNSGDLPDVDIPPPVESVKSQIQNQALGARLIPEQIGPVQSSIPGQGLVSSELIEGEFKVNYKKLNLKQIVDLGAQMQNISGSVKMRAVDINANPEDPRYLDVVFTVAVLKVPKDPTTGDF